MGPVALVLELLLECIQYFKKQFWYSNIKKPLDKSLPRTQTYTKHTFAVEFYNLSWFIPTCFTGHSFVFRNLSPWLRLQWIPLFCTLIGWPVYRRESGNYIHIYSRVSVSAPCTVLCVHIQTETGKPLRCVAVGVSVPAECNRCKTTRKLFISLINNSFIEAGALSLLLLYVSLPNSSLSLK